LLTSLLFPRLRPRPSPDQDLRLWIERFNLREHLDTIHVREVEIEDHRHRSMPSIGLYARSSIRGRHDLMPETREYRLEQVQYRGFIIHDKNPGHRSPHAWGVSKWSTVNRRSTTHTV